MAPPDHRPEPLPDPSYLDLHRAGALRERAESAVSLLQDCRLCPRSCGADRMGEDRGRCEAGSEALVASFGPHFGEEDCLVGRGGSGTIFFASCALKCSFCQNADISHGAYGRPTASGELGRIMLRLQNAGCANINLVTPTHFVPPILAALDAAAGQGLRIPLVYNSSGYESPETLALLDGVIDIYMPDLKTLDPALAERWFSAPDYPDCATASLRIMHEQVGALRLDEGGIARRGVLVRHLVMPDHLDDTRNVMEWLTHNLGPDTFVNVMGQYHPPGRVRGDPSLSRRLAPDECRKARDLARAAGLSRFAR